MLCSFRSGLHGLLTACFEVRYDLRGHGRSDKPDDAEGYESLKFAEDFAGVKLAFGLDKPIIVGWYVHLRLRSKELITTSP